MTSPMDWTLVFLLLVPVLVGLALLFLARWANRRNSARPNQSPIQGQTTLLSAFTRPTPVKSVEGFFQDPLPVAESLIGKLLAISVVLFVVAFLAFAAYAVLK